MSIVASVVFPAPDAPTNATLRLGGMTRLTPFKDRWPPLRKRMTRHRVVWADRSLVSQEPASNTSSLSDNSLSNRSNKLTLPEKSKKSLDTTSVYFARKSAVRRRMTSMKTISTKAVPNIST